jgi:hypothetical protein
MEGMSYKVMNAMVREEHIIARIDVKYVSSRPECKGRRVFICPGTMNRVEDNSNKKVVKESTVQCLFDKNELEYRSCKQPQCNHTECHDHEEFSIDRFVVATMQKHIGKTVSGMKDGECACQGKLLKVFLKKGAATFKVQVSEGKGVRIFGSIHVSEFVR